MAQYYCLKHDNYHVTDDAGCEYCQAEWETEQDKENEHFDCR